MKLGSAAAVTLGMMSSNHTKAHSLVERFRYVESVDLVGLGHDRVLGLDVAFRHGAALSQCLCRRGKLRERAQLTRREGESFQRASGRWDGSPGQLYVSVPGKGLGGTLARRRGPN